MGEAGNSLMVPHSGGQARSRPAASWRAGHAGEWPARQRRPRADLRDRGCRCPVPAFPRHSCLVQHVARRGHEGRRTDLRCILNEWQRCAVPGVCLARQAPRELRSAIDALEPDVEGCARDRAMRLMARAWLQPRRIWVLQCACRASMSPLVSSDIARFSWSSDHSHHRSSSRSATRPLSNRFRISLAGCPPTME